jgi:hypothetical protein
LECLILASRAIFIVYLGRLALVASLVKDHTGATGENAAAKDLGNMAEKVDDTLISFNNTAAKDAYHLALAKADGIF